MIKLAQGEKMCKTFKVMLAWKTSLFLQVAIISSLALHFSLTWYYMVIISQSIFIDTFMDHAKSNH